MSYGAAGAAAGAHAAAIGNAIKASGAIVSVEPTEFTKVLSKADSPLVVVAETRVLKTTYQYLAAYKGLVFFTKSYSPVQLPSRAELIVAKKIWIPS